MDIKIHYETKHNDLKHTCESCYKKFPRPKDLRIHVKTVHSTFRNFFCDFCKKGYAEKFQLRRHLKTHEGKSKFKQSDDFMEDFRGKSDEFKITKEKPVEFVKVEKALEEVDDDDMIDDKSFDFKSIKQEINDDKISEIDRIFEPLTIVKIEVEQNQSFIKEEVNSDYEDEKLNLLEYSCDLCFKIFTSKSLIRKHINKIHLTVDNNPLQCNVCKKEFNKMQHLKDHHLAIHTDHTFNCNSCDRTFSFKSALARHRKVVHENKKNFVCSQCGKKFGTNFDLQQHFTGHHSEVSKLERTCKFCNKTFMKERNLRMHIEAIHGEKKFICEICSKIFSYKSAMDRHLKVVHYKHKSHKCSVCAKIFGNRYDLTNHFDFYHSNENSGKYQCHECQKSFISSSALFRHQKGVHENIKQKAHHESKCKICKEILSNKYQKEKHMAQVHLDGKKMTRTCGYCYENFKLFDDFKAHIESHYGFNICITCGQFFFNLEEFTDHVQSHKKIEMNLRKFTCDFCNHRLFNKIQLTVHMRKHVEEKNFYVCHICGQSYKFIAPFLYHKKLHENKKDFLCTFCPKTFIRKQDLIVHTRQHTQEKPFKCNVCNKRFSHKPVLNNHLKIHLDIKENFKCKDCNLVFKERQQLNSHDDEYHPEKRPFSCNLCNTSFKFEHTLKAHRTHKHKELFLSSDLNF